MDYQLSELQQMLQESAEKFFEREYDFSTRQQLAAAEPGYSEENWQQFAELGWLGIPFSEEQGGFGGGAVELMVLFEQFGRALLVEPYLANVVLAGQLLASLGSEQQVADLLFRLIGGELKMAFAHSEPGSRYELSRVACEATRTDSGYLLNGCKSLVLNGQHADQLLVTARTAGGINDRHGMSLFLVPADRQGLTVRGYQTVDALRAADLNLQQVELPEQALVGVSGEAYGAVEWVADQAMIALCAEALGCMEALLQATVEYLQTRKQFDTPIGKFQVLQHAAVDMFMAVSQSRSMVYLAAAKAQADEAERRAAVSAAKNFIGRAGRLVGQHAVQLHGGVGISDELIVSHYFKRLSAINTWFGDDNHHLGLYSDQIAESF